MKKICIVILLIFCLPVFSNTVEQLSVQNQAQQPSITTPQNIPYESCTKMFAVNKEKLFYLTLGAISANNFLIRSIFSTT